MHFTGIIVGIENYFWGTCVLLLFDIHCLRFADEFCFANSQRHLISAMKVIVPMQFGVIVSVPLRLIVSAPFGFICVRAIRSPLCPCHLGPFMSMSFGSFMSVSLAVIYVHVIWGHLTSKYGYRVPPALQERIR